MGQKADITARNPLQKEANKFLTFDGQAYI